MSAERAKRVQKGHPPFLFFAAQKSVFSFFFSFFLFFINEGRMFFFRREGPFFGLDAIFLSAVGLV
jgi:hypothetical protein